MSMKSPDRCVVSLHVSGSVRSLCVDARSGETDVHHFQATAPSHPADRGGVEVISADGKAAMSRSGRLHVGDVYPMPALLLAQPSLHPCVAGSLSGMPGAGAEIAAYVASRESHRAAARDEHVRLVLTHAFAAFERGGRGILHCRSAWPISDAGVHSLRQVVQPPTQRTWPLQMTACQRDDPIARGRQ